MQRGCGAGEGLGLEWAGKVESLTRTGAKLRALQSGEAHLPKMASWFARGGATYEPGEIAGRAYRDINPLRIST